MLTDKAMSAHKDRPDPTEISDSKGNKIEISNQSLHWLYYTALVGVTGKEDFKEAYEGR